MSDPDLQKIFGTPEQWREGYFTEAKHGVIDVALGGSLFGIIGVSAAGPWFGMSKGLDGAVLMGFLASFAGAIGGALLCTFVGALGELICGKLSLDRALRTKLGGRLDTGRGRLLYGGLLGAIGGPIITLLVRGIYEGFNGIIDSIFIGVI